MKNMFMKALSSLILLTTLNLGAYTFRVCYNGSNDASDTDVPNTITLHSHIAGGDCWTNILPDLTIPNGSFKEINITPNMTKLNYQCHPYPETANGNSIKPIRGSWPQPPLKPSMDPGAGQTWQIFKTKEPQNIGEIRYFDLQQRTFVTMPIFNSWFAEIQDGINTCALPQGMQTQPTKKETPPPTKQPEERLVKKAGIIPYCVDPKTHEVKLLLSYGPTKHTLWGIAYSYNAWADFGGSVEKKDYINHPDDPDDAIKEAAARETHEETMGYFSTPTGDDARTKKATEAGTKFWMGKLKEENRVKTKSGYHYWFAEVSCSSDQIPVMRDLHDIYSLLSDKNGQTPTIFGYSLVWDIEPSTEKSDFRWVSANEILEQLEATQSTGKPLQIKDPEDPSKMLELYYRYEQSLREGYPVLSRINGPIKKRISVEKKVTEEEIKKLSPEEQKAFTDMLANVNTIKQNLLTSLEDYKNALATKNQDARKDSGEQIVQQLISVKELLKTMNEATEKNTDLGKLIKDRLTPEIEQALHTKAEEHPNLRAYPENKTFEKIVYSN